MSDVPALHEYATKLASLAMDDEELLRGLSYIAPLLADEPEQRAQVEFEAVRLLLGKILNRADAVGAESDDELADLYRQIERARFAQNLTGDVLVPLVAISFDFDEPVEVEGTVWLERLTEEEHCSRALAWLRHDAVSPWVAAAATHAVVIRDVTFPNSVHSWNLVETFPRQVFDPIAERVAQAVHIVTAKRTGYAQVLVRPTDWADSWTLDLPPLWQAETGRFYPESLNKRDWDKTREAISDSQLADVIAVTTALKEAPKNVGIAARRSRRTTFRDDHEDVILDAAIGIEALVGLEPDALTHRMAQRAAAALADEIPPENAYFIIKQFYRVRSKIVHGEALKSWSIKLHDKQMPAWTAGNYMLRKLLQSNLLADEPWTAESLDAALLGRLERPGGYPTGGSEDNGSD